jgi:hypothetical protein
LKRRATAGPLESANHHQGRRPTITHQLQATALDEIGELLADQGFDGLADALRVLLNEVMKLERAAVLNAAPYQRSEGRTGHANGYKPNGIKPGPHLLGPAIVCASLAAVRSATRRALAVS